MAREAVVKYYADHGRVVDAEQVILTTSTSEAYGYLFKLLCDPGDQILVPQPSYPLFDFLADAELVKIVGADLIYDHGWLLDMEDLRRKITDKTRAIVLVHPNNPTGHFTSMLERARLVELCLEHNLALIVDEVFLDYGFSNSAPHGEGEQAGDRRSFAGQDLARSSGDGMRLPEPDFGTPVFVVSGLSKIAGLPQMKVAWLVASGRGSSPALQRLEILADTYLSMNAPMQRALPVWLEKRNNIQNQIQARTQKNLEVLDKALAGQPREQTSVNRLRVQGGWYAVLRIPAVQPDETTVKELLARGVWVYPGYFFGFGNGWLVVSLLGETAEFRTGVIQIMNYFEPNRWEP